MKKEETIDTLIDRMSDRKLLQQLLKDEMLTFYKTKCKSKVDVGELKPHVFGSWYDAMSDKHFFCCMIGTTTCIEELIAHLGNNKFAIEQQANTKRYKKLSTDCLTLDKTIIFVSMKGDWSNG